MVPVKGQCQGFRPRAKVRLSITSTVKAADLVEAAVYVEAAGHQRVLDLVNGQGHGQGGASGH